MVKIDDKQIEIREEELVFLLDLGFLECSTRFLRSKNYPLSCLEDKSLRLFRLRYDILIYFVYSCCNRSVWRYFDGHHVLLEPDTELSGAINIHKVHFD